MKAKGDVKVKVEPSESSEEPGSKLLGKRQVIRYMTPEGKEETLLLEVDDDDDQEWGLGSLMTPVKCTSSSNFQRNRYMSTADTPEKPQHSVYVPKIPKFWQNNENTAPKMKEEFISKPIRLKLEETCSDLPSMVTRKQRKESEAPATLQMDPVKELIKTGHQSSFLQKKLARHPLEINTQIAPEATPRTVVGPLIM